MPTVKKRRIIGVTGGIATGKSTVLKELRGHGFATIASDDVAHRCLRRGHPCYRRIVRHFGRSILTSGGEIDRRRLGKIVFADPGERRWLERQIHPAVIKQLRSFIRKHRRPVALDIPLLFEAKLENLVDHVLVIWSTPQRQLARLKARDGLAAVEARRRLRAQLPMAYKKRRADSLIPNNATLSTLRTHVTRWLDTFR